MAAELGSDIAVPCDVSSDEEIERAFAALRGRWDGLDGLVHAIAFAPREAIAGDFLEGLSREAFRIAHDVSSYSFPALAKAALPMMAGRTGAMVTLTYLGAERVGAALQHHGPREGEPRGRGALPRCEPRPEGHAGQRDLGRADQDARGERHRGLRQDPQVRRDSTRRCGAT